MATLIKWEDATPADFYSTKSHMWILLKGKVRMSQKKKEMIHACIWGNKAWDIPERGYYNDSYGLIHCHGRVTRELIYKLAKKFPRAIYIKSDDEVCNE